MHLCEFVQYALSCSAISSAPRDRVFICNSPVCCASPSHGCAQTVQDPSHHLWGWWLTTVSLFRQWHACCFQVKKLIMWDHLGSSGRLSVRARADYSNSTWAPSSLQIKKEHTSRSETSETRLQVSFQKPVFQLWPLLIRSQAQHGATSPGSMLPWAEILL